MIYYQYILIYTIVLPIVFGLYRYHQLDLTFRILLWDRIIGFFREVGFDYIPGPQAKHLFQIVFTLQEVSFVFYAFLVWGQKKQPAKKTFILLIILSILFFAELTIKKENIFQYSLIDPAAYLILVFVGLDSLAVVLRKMKNKKEKYCKASILIGLSISNIHYVLFNIFSYFFYSQKNAGFFIKLYFVNLLFYVVTNLIFTAVFIWYPKKQQFL